MKRVFQQKISAINGDCMQAVFASLFEMELKDVPAFIEYGSDYHKKIREFIATKGYKFKGTLINRAYFVTYPATVFERSRPDNAMLRLKNYEGINGLFWAGVYSPGFFDEQLFTEDPDYSAPTHAVIVNKYCEIVFDPNPNYQNVTKYPRADDIGFNGIMNVSLIEKI